MVLSDQIEQDKQLSPEEILQKEYLTADQVAILLQVSVKSVYRWAKDDPSMHVLTIGRTVRFHRERLLRWLRTREQGLGQAKRFRQPVPHNGEPLEKLKESMKNSAPCARL